VKVSETGDLPGMSLVEHAGDSFSGLGSEKRAGRLEATRTQIRSIQIGLDSRSIWDRDALGDIHLMFLKKPERPDSCN